MKQPQKLPLDHMYHILPAETRQNHRLISYKDDIAVALGIGSLFFHHIEMLLSPYLLDDYRMGMVLRGTMRAFINLREQTMQVGTIVFVTPGTIVEPVWVSDDFLLEGVGLSAERFQSAHIGRLPSLFNGEMTEGRIMVPDETRTLIDRMFHLLHDLMEQPTLATEAVYGMVSAISHYYSHLFAEHTTQVGTSHTGEMFNKFLRLVNRYGRREHRLSFYADRLCVTRRYLGTVVFSTSGVSASEWIDRAVISSAKVMLRHGNKQITEIASELNFANVSFFCKYFKRIAGVTPTQYRQGIDG